MPAATERQKRTTGRVMHEFKHGELKSGPAGKGGKVKSRKQAIAIALHEAGESKDDSPKTRRKAKAKTARKEAAGKTAQQTREGKSHIGARGKRESSKAMGGKDAKAPAKRARKKTSPGACSLAGHIALHEAGLTFDCTKVDLKAHKTEDGQDFYAINPKGYVPAFDLGGGEILTENVAILSWIADQKQHLNPEGPLARYRLLEMLAFITSEIHKSFKPLFSPDSSDADKTKAKDAILKRLTFLAGRMKSEFLFDARMTVADAYLFVMLLWSRKNDMTLPKPPDTYAQRLSARPAVQLAFKHEELEFPAWC